MVSIVLSSKFSLGRLRGSFHSRGQCCAARRKCFGHCCLRLLINLDEMFSRRSKLMGMSWRSSYRQTTTANCGRLVCWLVSRLVATGYGGCALAQ